MPSIAPRLLSAHAFAPFGDVLAFDPAQAWRVNDGNALRADLPVRFSYFAGQPKLALFRVDAQRLPMTVNAFERHPNSSQVFFPISADRFLVVMAPRAADGAPDAGKAEAFIGQRGQGVAYLPDVWHAPIVALDTDGDFLMLIWEQDAPEDCCVERLPVPLQICSDPL
jgi:ureidoglycolate lyase